MRLAKGITIERNARSTARERDYLQVTYKLSNETSFKIERFTFLEKFNGVQEEFYEVKLDSLNPSSRKEVVKKVHLNNGMGVKTFEPIEIIFKDELGLFEFKVSFKDKLEVEVLPFIENSPQLINRVSPYSIQFGLFDIVKRGDSNLFIGTRPYVHGDPVKKINWKLSLKGSTLVVNEFEKSTNTFITFLLDLDYDNQLGAGQISTWEICKDLALSLIVNEINRFNSIQLISNNLYIPFGSGPGQLSTIEKHFTHHELRASSDDSHLRHLFEAPREGQIYYLCPMVPTAKIYSTLEFLKKLRAMNYAVTIFTFNPYQELLRSMRGDFRMGLLEMERHAKLEFKKIEKELQLQGTPLVEIELQKDLKLKEQILQKGKNLLEVK